MRAYYRLFLCMLLLFALMIGSVNMLLSRRSRLAENHAYRVEISRLSKHIEAGETDPALSDCEYVTAVRAFDGSSKFFSLNGSYAVQEINGTLYRFDYRQQAQNRTLRLWLNGILGFFALAMTGLMLYIRSSLLKPFARLADIPAELAKGNLTAPLSEQRSRYFGKFVWGVNMLRETLEQAKQRETELQKEQQTLILSVSHDIKTPLSAIKLYAKALEKGLYSDEAKRLDAAVRINSNADQIEQYVSELTKSASEDFIQVQVENSEFYLSGLIESLRGLYAEKFALQQIPFEIEAYQNCLLFGDADRAVEVMQNLLENALKYGEGGRTRISFDEEEDCRLITVANSGCTLPEAEAVHMFDSFWRGSNAEGKHGSGLGLYICRKLMHAMEGEIFSQITDGEMRVTAVFRKL